MIAAAFALAAIIIALVAIRRSDNLAQAADTALVRERSQSFELQVLTRLAQTLGYYTAGSGNAMRNLLLLLPDNELPGLRAVVGDGCGSTEVSWLSCEDIGFAVFRVVDAFVLAAEVVRASSRRSLQWR